MLSLWIPFFVGLCSTGFNRDVAEQDQHTQHTTVHLLSVYRFATCFTEVSRPSNFTHCCCRLFLLAWCDVTRLDESRTN